MQKKYTVLIIILSGAFSIMGCMDLYGKIRPNPDVLKLYAHRTGLPDYDYYYTGRANLPDAVIGIDKKYKFNARLWGQIKTHKDVFNKIYNLNDTPFGDSDLIAGDVLDNKGLKIGVWFSNYYQTIVKKTPEGRVDVYTPYSPDDFEDDFL
ncbi:hypothetical protein [Desulfobacula sp.]